MKRRNIIAAVEIGTTKVVALVGEVFGGRSLNIIGLGQATASGVRKGEITDLRAVSDCTHAALHAAEKNAGATIEGVYLAATGAHLSGFANRGMTQVSASDNIVSQEDIFNVAELAKSKALQPGRLYIHHIQGHFLLDGQSVAEPRGKAGEQLEVNYWHVHGDEQRLAESIHVINGYGLEVDDMILSSIASGSMVATEAEKEQGVLVVDCGAGTTDYALYRGGKILRTGTIPVGGDHLTNDLALGLRVNLKHAENLKRRFGKAIIDKTDKNDQVLLIGDLTIGDRPIPRLAIYKILQSRVDELLSILKNRLGSVISPQNLPGGVVLTGGSSRLSHIDTAAQNILGVPTRIAVNPSWVRDTSLRAPEYSTVLGLLYYGLTDQRQDETRPAPQSGRWLKRFTNIFAAN